MFYVILALKVQCVRFLVKHFKMNIKLSGECENSYFYFMISLYCVLEIPTEVSMLTS